MIESTVISACGYDERGAWEELITQVNDFISENSIARTDILEYKTRVKEGLNDDGYTWNDYSIILTVWKDAQ